MSKPHHLRIPLIGLMMSLLALSLILAACGGTPEPTMEPTPTEAPATAVDPATETTEPEPTTAPVEEQATEEATAETDGEAVAIAQAECQPADPNTDPIAGIVQSLNQYFDANPINDAIAPVADTDWVKGPADAPITVIEYGDFQ